jgi:hypothetical protein
MADNKALKLAAMLGATPQQGGLMYGDRPNPYGLRAYQENGQLGGQMMPKSTGWLGPISDLNGNVMTEFGVGDERGDFPSMVPTLNQEELTAIVSGKQVTPSAYKKAQDFANQRRAQGLNPFKDIEDR